MSRCNAQTILSLNRGVNPRDANSKDFLWNLGLQLLKPLVTRRRISPGYKLLTNTVKVSAKRVKDMKKESSRQYRIQ